VNTAVIDKAQDAQQDHQIERLLTQRLGCLNWPANMPGRLSMPSPTSPRAARLKTHASQQPAQFWIEDMESLEWRRTPSMRGAVLAFSTRTKRGGVHNNARAQWGLTNDRNDGQN
jgi:hypothetical protein